MHTWLWTFAGVTIVSGVSLIGILFLFINENFVEKTVFFLVSFAVGALFGDAFIHLLPETFKNSGNTLPGSLFTLAGLLLFFILEKFVGWRHCHVPATEKHVHPVVAMNILGDTVHNLIDGMVIGASFSISRPLGLATAAAVILHEIPHELGNFGVMLHGGLSFRKALLFNFLSSLAAFLGAAVSLAAGSAVEGYPAAMLPLTAGGFIYIAGSDLIPELHHETRPHVSLVQFLAILLGAGSMALLA